MNETQRLYVYEAKRLGDYESMSVEDLANGYCDAIDNNNELLKNSYISALMLRFWLNVGIMQKKCKAVTLYSYEDFVAQLYKCINTACKYRAWRDPNKKTTAKACINQTIASRGYPEILYESNQIKQKVNYNCVSLDSTLELNDGQDVSLADTLEDENATNEFNLLEGADAARTIIQKFINKNKIIEAIILDNIAFNDCEKHTKKIVKTVDENGEVSKYESHSSQFWKFRLVQVLSDLPKDYTQYFKDTYEVAAGPLDAAVKKIRAANNQKLSTYATESLKYVKSKLSNNI